MNFALSNDVQQNLDLIDLAFAEGQGYETIHQFILIKKIVGIALAKSLWLGEKHWNNPDETFRDYAVDEYSLNAATIKRYIDVWETVLAAPESLRDILIRKPMQELIPIATNVANGEIAPDNEQWEKLALTGSNGEAYNLIREMSGKEPDEDKLSLVIDMKTGDITSWQRGNPEYVGFLDVHRKDIVQVGKAIHRIINKSGLKEK